MTKLSEDKKELQKAFTHLVLAFEEKHPDVEVNAVEFDRSTFGMGASVLIRCEIKASLKN
jgi:hypothetical protein